MAAARRSTRTWASPAARAGHDPSRASIRLSTDCTILERLRGRTIRGTTYLVGRHGPGDVSPSRSAAGRPHRPRHRRDRESPPVQPRTLPSLRQEGTVKVKKAVIPAAGLGTRFLPATKAQPKEMLPVVDTPAIQLVVEEAVRAGLTDILIITGRSKRTHRGPLRPLVELEHFLEEKGKFDELKQVRALSRDGGHPLHPPGRGARAGPRGGGGRAARGRRAVRRAAGRRPDPSVDAAAARDAARPREVRAERDRRAGGLARGDRARTAASRPSSSTTTSRASTAIVEKPDARGRAVEPRRDRPLRVHAGDLRRARGRRSRAAAARSS